MPGNLALAPVRRGWLPAMAALSAAVFLMKWKGALHAIDLGIAWNHRKQRHPHLAAPFPMLIELCSEMIVRDSTTTKKVLPYLPQQIFYPIMRAAITKGHDRSMEVLLPAWPTPIFVLNHIWPDLYNTLTILYNSTAHNAHTRQGINITKSLINAFLNLIKTDRPTKLRILDLREFPTGDAMIYRLSEEIISFHEKQQLHFSERDDDGTTVYSTQSFEILLDCVVREDETFQELCTALKISQKPGSHLRMRIFKIDASCRGVSQISLLLDYLQPNDLVGLCIQYNSLSSEGLIKLAPKLKRLQSLTALDMSCNNLNLTQSSSACEVLAEVLGELKNLRRLDLSNNRLSNCVSQILGRTHHHKLEYLKLSACVLTRSDLTYLSSSHIHSISELDLSENLVLSQQVDVLANLLKALSSNLQVLELEDCNFNNHHLGSLINTFMTLSELQYMNFARNGLSSEALFTHLARLGSLPQLQCLRLSYSEDCYLEVSDSEMYDQRKLRLRTELEKQMAAFRSVLTESLPSVHLVWTEFLAF